MGKGNCSGGGACVIPQPRELYWRKLQLLAGLTKPSRSKGRIQTNRWLNRWQQDEGSAQSQADTTCCILAVSYCCSEENTAIVGRCCIHQLSNRQPKEKFPKRFDQWVSEWVICNIPIEAANICNILPRPAESNGLIVVKIKQDLKYRCYVYFEPVCPNVI